jgi:excisionase family DNA binding protein
MDENMKSILTVEDIAHILKIGKSKAYNLLKSEGFPVIKIGRQLRVSSTAFQDWINKQCSL